jgi:hypothetical protein
MAKKISQIFSENLAKEKRKEFYYIQNKIQRLCAMHADGVNIDITKLENLQKYDHSMQFHYKIHHTTRPTSLSIMSHD